jgi:uncharacterized protein (TIGR02996 family)
MHPEFALIREFLANPKDTTFLSILADWWEERGDRRSELIRVYCEMSLVEFEDERFDQLESNLYELSRKLKDEWLTYPYVCESSEALYAYRLEPDGSKIHLGSTFSEIDLVRYVGDSPGYNRILTDSDAIFWNPQAQGKLNLPAMALIRDSENIHYDPVILPWDFVDDIRGFAIVVEGYDTMASFRY